MFPNPEEIAARLFPAPPPNQPPEPTAGLRPAAAHLERSANAMLIAVQVFPAMHSRPCRFCLSLQDGSVFADFDVDEEGRAFLLRISFDGYGCCGGEFKKMSLDDSHTLIAAVDQGAVQDPRIEMLLRTNLQKNTHLIWDDALATHELL